MKSMYLLETELWISDFQHFQWLTRHRLSVHIPAAKKQAENIFAAMRKNGQQKPFWTGIDRGRNRCFSGRVVDPGVLNRTILVLGLAAYNMILLKFQPWLMHFSCSDWFTQ